MGVEVSKEGIRNHKRFWTYASVRNCWKMYSKFP